MVELMFTYPGRDPDYSLVVDYFEDLDLFVGDPVVVGDVVKQSVMVDDYEDAEYIVERMRSINRTETKRILEVTVDIKEPIHDLPEECQSVTEYVLRYLDDLHPEIWVTAQMENIWGFLYTDVEYDDSEDAYRLLKLMELFTQTTVEHTSVG